jgi:K+-sensing histidine kinase KdpD
VASRLDRLAVRLSRQSRFAVTTTAVALVGVLMVVDYATGTELSFSIFYLLPIALASWFGDRRMGLLTCALSGLAWMAVDLALASYSHALIHFWNSLVRFGFFVSVSMLLSEVKRARERQEELLRFLANDLRAPLRNAMLGLDILEHEAGANMDSTARQVVNLTRSAGTRMWSLVHSLIELTRFEDSEMPLERFDVPVERLLRSAFDQINLWAWNRGIRLQADGALETASVHVDASVTVRVLVNLLTHLIETVPSTSTVTVALCPSAAGALSLSIASDGIPGEAVASGERKTAHADLGLRFCEHAMHAQGGDIWLALERGEVGVTLPETPGAAGVAAG